MKKSFKLLSLMIIASMTLTGCSSLKDEMITAMNSNTDITLSVDVDMSAEPVRAKYDWVELDQLTTFRDLRKTWDDTLHIIRFDVNSKNGSLFVDTSGEWNGNNTLYNVFQNKVFVNDYWKDSKVRSTLAQAAIAEFSDISNEGTGIVASVNAYFNLLPTNEDGTSGMFNNLTRAEAMTAIYKGDTSVILNEENADFAGVVGENDLNIYAQEMEQYSYLDTATTSLNKTTYNEPITRAEAIYMIIQKFYKDEYDSLSGKEGGLSDCKNAGRVADKQGFTDGYAWKAYELEFCLQNQNKGVTEDLYKALVVAYNHNIISSDTRWYAPIAGGELIQILINTYDGFYGDNQFLANAKLGENAGQSLIIKEDNTPETIIEELPSEVVVQKIKDISDIDKLIEVYGDEIDMTEEEIEEARRNAEGYTIEPVDKYMLVDFCTWLNVRVGPSTDFKIKKSVPKETQVHIVGKCAENGWYRVIADGKISYQCGVYFSDLPGQDTSNLVQEYETDEQETNKTDSNKANLDTNEAGLDSTEQNINDDSVETNSDTSEGDSDSNVGGIGYQIPEEEYEEESEDVSLF